MPRCSRRIESYQALTVRSCTSAVNLSSRFHESMAPMMPSPFFKKVEGREGIMPSASRRSRDSSSLETLVLPGNMVSRLRHDAI